MEAVRYHIDDFDSTVAESFYGDSLFSSLKFMKLWETIGGVPVYWVLEEAGSIVGIYPGVEFITAGLKRFQSMPDGLYGNLYTNENHDYQKAAELLLASINSYGYMKIYLFDYTHQFKSYQNYNVEPCSTILIDISDEAWIPPDKKLQSELRKANREEFEVVKFKAQKHLTKFIDLMRQTEHRHNRKQKYPDIFFEKLSEIAEDDNRILWYWCEQNQQAVTSHINLIEHQMVLHWQVYFDKKYSYLKANQKIIFDMANNLRDCNIQTLNLGGSPVKAESLVDYKLKWGGEEFRYNSLVKKTLLGKII